MGVQNEDSIENAIRVLDNARKALSMHMPNVAIDGRIEHVTQSLRRSEEITLSGSKLTQNISPLSMFNHLIGTSLIAIGYHSNDELVLELVDPQSTSAYESHSRKKLAFHSRLNFLEDGRFELKVDRTENQEKVQSRLDRSKIVLQHNGTKHVVQPNQLTVGLLDDNDIEWLNKVLANLRFDQGRKSTKTNENPYQEQGALGENRRTSGQVSQKLLLSHHCVHQAKAIIYSFAVQLGELIRERTEQMQEAIEREAELIRCDVYRREIAHQGLQQFEHSRESVQEEVITVGLYDIFEQPYQIKRENLT